MRSSVKLMERDLLQPSDRDWSSKRQTPNNCMNNCNQVFGLCKFLDKLPSAGDGLEKFSQSHRVEGAHRVEYIDSNKAAIAK